MNPTNWHAITLDYFHASHSAMITLNRPLARNALNTAMMVEIQQAFTLLSQDANVRAIVLAANGAVFCAGADLQEMKAEEHETLKQKQAHAQQLADMLRTVYLCPKPVIAKIRGDAYGGGMGLLAACDIRIASETVYFCLSEVRLGLIPAIISPYVIKAMGENAARRYFLTAERFLAHEAQHMGLVHQVAPNSDALTKAISHTVNILAENSPHAVQQAKKLVREIANTKMDDNLITDTVQRFVDIRTSPEGQEGMHAFLTQRKPDWQRKE